MSDSGRRINRFKLTKRQVRQYRTELVAILNSRDDERLRDFMRLYGISIPEDEHEFERMVHISRLRFRGVWPKLKKESREWLMEYERTRKHGEKAE